MLYIFCENIPILIMECLPMSLTNYLEQNKIIPNHIKNSILLDVSLGLLYLHTQTPYIIDCDLTANNVLLTSLTLECHIYFSLNPVSIT